MILTPTTVATSALAPGSCCINLVEFWAYVCSQHLRRSTNRAHNRRRKLAGTLNRKIGHSVSSFRRHGSKKRNGRFHSASSAAKLWPEGERDTKTSHLPETAARSHPQVKSLCSALLQLLNSDTSLVRTRLLCNQQPCALSKVALPDIQRRFAFFTGRDFCLLEFLLFVAKLQRHVEFERRCEVHCAPRCNVDAPGQREREDPSRSRE
jgi:hypothetical protein